ncbi:MAG: hypothetical protein WBF58_02355 [Xanthobacteraceae bacterium]
MFRRLLPAAALLVATTAAAFAQLPMGMTLRDQPKELTPQERAKQKAIDDAYRAANKKIPDKKTGADPWGSIRSGPSSGSGQSGN